MSNTKELRARVDEYCNLSKEINRLTSKQRSLRKVIESEEWFDGNKFRIELVPDTTQRLDIDKIRVEMSAKWLAAHTKEPGVKFSIKEK